MWLFKILTFLSILGTASCGFTPLYSKRGYTQSPLNETHKIYIAPIYIEKTYGQQLRNHLKDKLQPAGEKEAEYRLDIKIDKSLKYQAIRQDATATHALITYTANYKLYSMAMGKEVYKGSARATVGYNILSSIYATTSSEDDAKNRAMQILSDDIALGIAAFIKDN